MYTIIQYPGNIKRNCDEAQNTKRFEDYGSDKNRILLWKKLINLRFRCYCAAEIDVWIKKRCKREILFKSSVNKKKSNARLQQHYHMNKISKKYAI